MLLSINKRSLLSPRKEIYSATIDIIKMFNLRMIVILRGPHLEMVNNDLKKKKGMNCVYINIHLIGLKEMIMLLLSVWFSLLHYVELYIFTYCLMTRAIYKYMAKCKAGMHICTLTIKVLFVLIVKTRTLNLHFPLLSFLAV